MGVVCCVGGLKLDVGAGSGDEVSDGLVVVYEVDWNVSGLDVLLVLLVLAAEIGLNTEDSTLVDDVSIKLVVGSISLVVKVLSTTDVELSIVLLLWLVLGASLDVSCGGFNVV